MVFSPKGTENVGQALLPNSICSFFPIFSLLVTTSDPPRVSLVSPPPESPPWCLLVGALKAPYNSSITVLTLLYDNCLPVGLPH